MTDDTPKLEREGRSPRETARIIVTVVLLALLIAFVVDNTREVKVGFVFGDHKTRLIYVFVVTFLLGVVLDRLWQRARRNR